MSRCLIRWVLSILVALPGLSLAADSPRVLPEGQTPGDVRLGPLRTLNNTFPFEPPRSVAEWQTRAEQLRRRLRVGLGLWPMPTRTPLGAVVHGRRDMGDYSVAKVYLQSYPGHYVTGNLYRPARDTGKRAGVLCPHGHWPGGRFLYRSEADARTEIGSGAEDFDAAGRSVLQARCVHLARLGCVVFHYDMVGYADSGQLSHGSGLRDALAGSQVGTWGFGSPQAASRLQTLTGLQTYNSIRALDFLLSLEDVDPSRIGVTGGSGGGTQTFLLTALDPRVRVALPAVMVSTAMQGGCACENAPYMRIESGNVEIAALCAPRPLALTGASDWTHEILTRGYPQLKQLYQTLGHADHVHVESFLQFGHNYNARSREVLYRWFNRHLDLGIEAPEREREFEGLSSDDLTVWNEQHPRPLSGPAHERELLAWMTRDADRRLLGLWPGDSETLEEYRRVVGGGFDVLIGRTAPPPEDLEWNERVRLDRGHHVEYRGLLRTPSRGEEIPLVVLSPDRWRNQILVWVHPEGKRSLFDAEGEPNPEVARLLKEGWAVTSADLFQQGEFLGAGSKPAARLVPDGPEPWRHPFVYTFGYNAPLFSRRVHDLLALTSFARGHASFPHRAPVSSRQIHMAGIDGAGHWVAAAVAQAGSLIDHVAMDTNRFRFERLERIDHPDFLPGAVKYGDLPGLIALAAPRALWLADEGTELPDVVAAAYRACSRAKAVQSLESATGAHGMVEWFIEQQNRER